MSPSPSAAGSHRILWGVLAIALFAVTQLGWWVTFHLKSDLENIRTTAEHLERERQAAEATLVEMVSRETLGAEGPAAFLARSYPHLAWTAEARPGQALVPGYPGYGVTVNPAPIDRLMKRRHSAIRMFVGEGSAFLLILAAGVTVTLRSIRREMSLMRQQANFLSAVTHELKSPLASIRLFVETLQMREVSAEKRTRYLNNMRADVDRLEALVNNVLAVARLDSGRFVVHPAHGDLKRDLVDLTKVVREELAHKKLAVELEMPDHGVEARYDLGVLRTVMRNLLENAAKYGKEHPVQLRLRAQSPWAVLDVTDQGIGLAAEEHEKVFQKFYRVGDEMVRQSEGTGLGLYLVRELLRQSGGDISAHSDGLGRGTTFRVRLPLSGGQA
jgi:signal transduction histidine kinase